MRIYVGHLLPWAEASRREAVQLCRLASLDCRVRTGHPFLTDPERLVGENPVWISWDKDDPEEITNGIAIVRLGEVAAIYVDASLRRHGIARALLDSIATDLKGHTLTAKIHADNLPSQELFRGAGYSRIDLTKPGSLYWLWRKDA